MLVSRYLKIIGIKSKKIRFYILIILVSIVFVFTQISTLNAVVGVPEILNHQGRLLDSDGNLLGGSSGTNYCFRFSIHDNATVGSGNKLWPTDTPSTMTVLVTNGVFNVGIGDTSNGGDTLNYNFHDNDNIYLNVAVAAQVSSSCVGVTFETVSPRQRILSSGYAINSNTVASLTPLSGNWLFQNGTVSTTGELSVADVFQAGVGSGENTTTTYARFGNSTAGHTDVMGATNDLLISGSLEVDGLSYFDSSVFFTNVSSTDLSAYEAWFVSTSTSSFDSAGVLRLVSASAPTTDVAGELAFDNNGWAASRGAIQVYDGTATTYLIGALASDTPTNGQVPKWNTGGTITWEADATATGAADPFTFLTNYGVINAVTTTNPIWSQLGFNASSTSHLNYVSSTAMDAGTILSGTWNGTTIAVTSGGTGATSLNNLITLGDHTTGNYLATLADAGGLTVSNSGSETAAVTVALDLTNANTWTGLQQFNNATTTNFSAYEAWFGATATSTFNTNGSLTMASNIRSDANNTDDLGAYGFAWNNIYASSTAYLDYVSSTSFTSAHTSSTKWFGGGLNVDCDAENQALSWDLSSQRFVCGDDDTTAGADPFTFLTNYGVINAVTTTNPIWSQLGFNASSTSHLNYVSSTAMDAGTILSGTWNGTTIAVTSGGTGATSLNNLITLGDHTTGNYLATLADAGGLTVSNSGSETAAVTVALDLTNANTWTGLQQFNNATTTNFSAYEAWFGATATSTFNTNGSLTMASNIRSDANNIDDLGAYGFAWNNIYASSTAYLDYVSSTSFTSAHTSSTKWFGGGLNVDCDAENQALSWDLSTQRFVCGDDDTTAGADPFTFLTNYGVINAVTTTNPIWSQLGFNASSTSHLNYVSSTAMDAGTILSGTWNGTTIAVTSGGTGATSLNNLITLGDHTTGNYLATLADAGGLTVSNSGSETAAVTVALDLTNANTWTGLQQFNNATTTNFSAYEAWFG